MKKVDLMKPPSREEVEKFAQANYDLQVVLRTHEGLLTGLVMKVK